MIDLTQNYYELFGLPQSFLVDQTILSDKYRQLQKQFHPDKFAGKSAAEQRLSVQFTSLLNSAYQTLKSPLLSAEYLLELANHPVNSDSLTISDGSFLFKQMEWREQLADLSENIKLGNVDAVNANEQLDTLNKEVDVLRKELIQVFDQKYHASNYEEAKEAVAKLHFVEKMLVNIEQLEDALIDC